MKEKDNLVKQVVIDEEGLHGIKIYGALNLENLPRTVSIY